MQLGAIHKGGDCRRPLLNTIASEQDLVDIGISSKFNRRRIWQQIQDFRLAMREFDQWLDEIQMRGLYKSQLEKHGVVTVGALLRIIGPAKRQLVQYICQQPADEIEKCFYPRRKKQHFIIKKKFVPLKKTSLWKKEKKKFFSIVVNASLFELKKLIKDIFNK
ncbi:hypothetical protein RFI_29866 [Reticulomyxa filosa]|uniref:Uncharacterized protein n=1 Tax=Reticulomyxa filosa TaxID=46433 RepID=X6M1P3_RETFI|nr:hypothetical protein RFI_29866 [Reticulomyxa filosa]|eukprot:ETO07526.1 hypothetical protein RFI_29866 [Reticulomyxa filosa]